MRKTLVLISILLLAALAVAGCGQSAEKLNQLPVDSVAEVAFAGRSNAGLTSRP